MCEKNAHRHAESLESLKHVISRLVRAKEWGANARLTYLDFCTSHGNFPHKDSQRTF